MSFLSGAPLKRARNLLLGGDGYRSRLLLNLNDPINGRDAVTGTIFQIQDAGNPSAGLYTASGRFLEGYYANGPLTWTGSRGLSSVVASRVWDVASDTGDFQLTFWVQCQSAPATIAYACVTLNEEPFDSNNFIAVSIGSNAARTTIRVTFTSSQSNNFVQTCAASIPYDGAWHFVCVGRIGNTHYVSIDGSGPGAGTTMNLSYRRSPGPRTVLIGTNGNTGQSNAIFDAIWLVDGSPYDLASGFAVPTAAPVLV